ncbi:hypothetical protein D8674_036239 [Pyrus ussuriensis x Pyrus communis]|uniref:Uncharacterized protein n=1 Tax=Pyrus ussuriensis x Pyrus communis TaxID=2448454 RepID=A0A5N5GFW5_9ROSA|nr:hypothetical protein D8674_036239 [Pyrus ussuriensis x Pyrus communis]
MVATFLLTIIKFTTRNNFKNILKALNTIAPNLMVQPGSTVPTKIKESTRFYPYFKLMQGCTTFFARSVVLMNFQLNQKMMNLKMKKMMMN